MNRLRVNLELVGVVHEQHAHPTEGVHIEMQQVIIVTSDGMVTDDREADILVDQSEQLAHILFQILERVPDVHLRHIFAVGRRVLELKPLTVFWTGVIDNPIAIAAAIWIHQT